MLHRAKANSRALPLSAAIPDDWSGNDFSSKWPFPMPRPNWFTNELNGIDLAVMATQFEQAAKKAFSPDLRKNLAHASVKLAEAGLSKMR